MSFILDSSSFYYLALSFLAASFFLASTSPLGNVSSQRSLNWTPYECNLGLFFSISSDFSKIFKFNFSLQETLGCSGSYFGLVFGLALSVDLSAASDLSVESAALSPSSFYSALSCSSAAFFSFSEIISLLIPCLNSVLRYSNFELRLLRLPLAEFLMLPIEGTFYFISFIFACRSLKTWSICSFPDISDWDFPLTMSSKSFCLCSCYYFLYSSYSAWAYWPF